MICLLIGYTSNITNFLLTNRQPFCIVSLLFILLLQVLEFAGDELAFLETLGVAFAKMINGNGEGMYSVANSPDLIF